MVNEAETQIMTQFNFELPCEMLTAFKVRAASERKSMAEILRESVRNYIEPKAESQVKTA